MENNTVKFRVCGIVTGKAYFTGSSYECNKWLDNYGLGRSQFEILPFDGGREYGDIGETY